MSAFTAIASFESPELKSHYERGLSYTARDPEEPGISDLARKNRAILRELLPTWVEEKKVVMGVFMPAGEAVAAPSGVAGTGEVTD